MFVGSCEGLNPARSSFDTHPYKEEQLGILLLVLAVNLTPIKGFPAIEGRRSGVRAPQDRRRIILRFNSVRDSEGDQWSP